MWSNVNLYIFIFFMAVMGILIQFIHGNFSNEHHFIFIAYSKHSRDTIYASVSIHNFYPTLFANICIINYFDYRCAIPSVTDRLQQHFFLWVSNTSRLEKNLLALTVQLPLLALLFENFLFYKFCLIFSWFLFWHHFNLLCCALSPN